METKLARVYSEEEKQFVKFLLSEVEHDFRNKPEVLSELRRIRKEARSGNFNLSAAQRIFNLFSGHPELVYAFNTVILPAWIENVFEPQHDNLSARLIPNPKRTECSISAPKSQANDPASSTPERSRDPPEKKMSAESHRIMKCNFLNYLHGVSPSEFFSRTQPEAKKLLQVSRQELDAALLYLDNVKHIFVSHPQVFPEINEVLMVFSQGSFSISELVERVSDLICCRSDLKDAFKEFLKILEQKRVSNPDSRKKTNHPTESLLRSSVENKLSGSSQKPQRTNFNVGNLSEIFPNTLTAVRKLKEVSRCEIKAALSYFDRVKYVFANSPVVFREIIDIKKGFDQSSIDNLELIVRISKLIANRSELQSGIEAYRGATQTIERFERSQIFDPDSPPKSQAHYHGLFSNSRAITAKLKEFSDKELEVALSYLAKAKCEFSNQPKIFCKITEIKRRFYLGSCGNMEILDQVSNLFGSHPELKAGYFEFLTTREPSSISNLRNQNSSEFFPNSRFLTDKLNRVTRQELEVALSYLDKVKGDYVNQPQVFNEITDMRKMFYHGHINHIKGYLELVQRVSNIILNCPDLEAGFDQHLSTERMNCNEQDVFEPDSSHEQLATNSETSSQAYQQQYDPRCQ